LPGNCRNLANVGEFLQASVRVPRCGDGEGRQMRIITLVIAAVVAVLVVGSNAAPAEAQANRTFVSAHGLDSNDCSLGLPCRSFAAAILVTNPGGEIIALDPAGYGAVTITKAISIINDAVGEAAIAETVAGKNAITVNAGPSDVVNLWGLTLNGVNTAAATVGIAFVAGGALNIQHCMIREFGSVGIAFEPTESSTLTILDTTVSNIGGTDAAILLAPSGSGLAVSAYLERVQVIGNGQHGIDVNTTSMTGGSLRATIVDTVATGNPNGSGVLIPTLSTPTLTLIKTRLTNNQTGINAGSGTAYLAETTISGNSSNGFIIRPGAVFNSFGNNRITDTNNIGSLTPIGKQ
jgi:hypothetical protein